MQQNNIYIAFEYRKRSLSALLAEYARLSSYVRSVLDSEDENEQHVDDDTEVRYSLVKEEICERLLSTSDLTNGKYVDFEYFD